MISPVFTCHHLIQLFNIVLYQAGKTPLMVAAGEGHAAVVTMLLDAKADVNKYTNVRYSPTLMTVSWWLYSFLSLCCSVLVAVPGSTDDFFQSESHDMKQHSYPALHQVGETALTFAAGNGHIGVVKLLLDAKANTNRANKVVYDEDINCYHTTSYVTSHLTQRHSCFTLR
jgi:ankyrin repeat protein